MRSNAAIVPYTAKNGNSWIARTAAVGTQDDDANGTDAVADESTIATTCDDGRIILDNGLLRAIIAPDGTVRSLIDLDNGHELVPDGSGIGHYKLSATSHTSGTHGTSSAMPSSAPKASMTRMWNE